MLMEFFEKIYVDDFDGNLFLTTTPIYIHDIKQNNELVLTPQEYDKKKDLCKNDNL